MRGAVLAVAVVLLGAGCGSDCDEPGTVTFFWRFVGSAGTVVGEFRSDDPATRLDESGCGTTAADIEVTIDGLTDAFTCADANGIPAVAYEFFSRGRYPFRIDAVRDGKVTFTGGGVVDAPRCGNVDVTVDLGATSPSDFVVYYDFQGREPAGCAALQEQIAGIAYELRDPANRTVRATGFVDAQGAFVHDLVPCESPFGIVIEDLPLGEYSFPFFTAMTPAQQPVMQVCNAPVLHEGFPVLLDLGAFTQACSVGPASPLASWRDDSR